MASEKGNIFGALCFCNGTVALADCLFCGAACARAPRAALRAYGTRGGAIGRADTRRPQKRAVPAERLMPGVCAERIAGRNAQRIGKADSCDKTKPFLRNGSGPVYARSAWPGAMHLSDIRRQLRCLSRQLRLPAHSRDPGRCRECSGAPRAGSGPEAAGMS